MLVAALLRCVTWPGDLRGQLSGPARPPPPGLHCTERLSHLWEKVFGGHALPQQPAFPWAQGSGTWISACVWSVSQRAASRPLGTTGRANSNSVRRGRWWGPAPEKPPHPQGPRQRAVDAGRPAPGGRGGLLPA